MKLFITTKRLSDGSGFIAEVDWSKGDAGKVGTPAGVAYGDSQQEAHDSLEIKLLKKGHMVITPCNYSNQRINEKVD